MSTQTPEPTRVPLRTEAERAFAALLRAYFATTRRLSAALENDHGLTLSDYEVLLHLAHAPDRMMRRVDLARSVLLTPSGITRLLERLERSGYVERAKCESDARVAYALLTDTGYAKLKEASKSHVDDIRSHFGGRLSTDELGALHRLLTPLGPEHGEEAGCSA